MLNVGKPQRSTTSPDAASHYFPWLLWALDQIKKQLYKQEVKHVSFKHQQNRINVEDPSLSRSDYSTGPTLVLHMIIKRLATTARTTMTADIPLSFSLPARTWSSRRPKRCQVSGFTRENPIKSTIKFRTTNLVSHETIKLETWNVINESIYFIRKLITELARRCQVDERRSLFLPLALPFVSSQFIHSIYVNISIYEQIVLSILWKFKSISNVKARSALGLPHGHWREFYLDSISSHGQR